MHRSWHCLSTNLLTNLLNSLFCFFFPWSYLAHAGRRRQMEQGPPGAFIDLALSVGIVTAFCSFPQVEGSNERSQANFHRGRGPLSRLPLPGPSSLVHGGSRYLPPFASFFLSSGPRADARHGAESLAPRVTSSSFTLLAGLVSQDPAPFSF